MGRGGDINKCAQEVAWGVSLTEGFQVESKAWWDPTDGAWRRQSESVEPK